MVEIVLGALVVIGVFVFWCDVTDSWNNVFLWNKTGKSLDARFGLALQPLVQQLVHYFEHSDFLLRLRSRNGAHGPVHRARARLSR
jgi:hypothetical protein